LLIFFYFGEMNDRARITTLESYYDPMLAQIVYAKLKANRIPCFIADEYFLWAKPYLNEALGGVKIRIFEKDVEKCKLILEAKDEVAERVDSNVHDEFGANLICPYCSSVNTRYGVATIVKFHLPSVLASIFFFVPLYFRMAWHCFNCHREFE
jgi:hypothetical protein